MEDIAEEPKLTEPVLTNSVDTLEQRRSQSEADREFLKTRGIAGIRHDHKRSLSLLSEKKRELEIYTHRLVRRALPPIAPRKSWSPKIRKIQCGDFLSSPTDGKKKLQPLLRGGSLPEEYQIHGRKNADFEGFIPQTREGATLTNLGKRLYLIAGLSLNLTNTISCLHHTNFHWARLDVPKTFLARCGHSTVASNDRRQLVIFGGVNEYVRESKSQSCLNSITIFNTQNYTFEEIQPHGITVVQRRAHIAGMIGCDMIVYGGLSDRKKMLSDWMTFSMKTFKWSWCNVNGRGPGPLAYSAAASVFPRVYYNNAKFSLSELPRVKAANDPFKLIKDMGLYLFGGLGPDHLPHDKLMILSVRRNECRWITPETQGTPPSARFQHSLVYCRNMNFLTVFGGRNNQASDPCLCFNDVHVLNIDQLLWSTVKPFGLLPTPRSLHTADFIDTTLFIFGGSSSKSFANSDLYIIEFDQNVVRKNKAEDARIEEARRIKAEIEERRLAKLGDKVQAENEMPRAEPEPEYKKAIRTVRFDI